MRTLIALLLMTGAANAGAQLCGDRGQLLSHLKDKYGETVTAVAVLGENGAGAVELLTSENTWTIIVTLANNPAISCVDLAGVNWTEKPKGVPM